MLIIGLGLASESVETLQLVIIASSCILVNNKNSQLCLQAINNRVYDHHAAIYYLIVDKLKQHRSSCPEPDEVQTQIRRPSSVAHTAIVRSTFTCSTAPAMPQAVSVARRPRSSVPVNPMEFGSGLEERVPTPPDIRHEIPGLCRQLININSRTPPVRRVTHTVPQTIQENVELDRGGVQGSAIPNVNNAPAVGRKRRHTVGVPPQGTISVPSDHPLLAGGLSNTNNTMYQIDPNPSIVVSPCDRVDFPSSDSGFHSANIEELVRGQNTAASRRFSEGNNPHLEFQQTRAYCSSSPLRLIQEEHQKLQELYRTSLTPAQMNEQQRLHTVYKEKYTEMQEELEKQYSKTVQKVETELADSNPDSNPLSLEFQNLHIQRHAYQPALKSLSHKRAAKKISPYSIHRTIERIDSDDIEYPPSETNDDYTLISL